MLLKHFYKLRDGIDQPSPAFANHMTLLDKQDRLMSNPQASEALQGSASDLAGVANAALSLQRASILFAASLGTFIGASLLLASI
jgi:hypothetical protein